MPMRLLKRNVISFKNEKKVKKIVLAYSGGLDTSVILRWLQENYHAEIIAYTADLGQEIDRKKIIRNATNLGVKNIVIEDLKDVFVKDYIFPMIRGNALYEGILFTRHFYCSTSYCKTSNPNC
jgi:argininosuccinate synthase